MIRRIWEWLRSTFTRGLVILVPVAITFYILNTIRAQIDADFLQASRDANFIKTLAQKLQQMGVFEEYQDRFFTLVKASQRQG